MGWLTCHFNICFIFLIQGVQETICMIVAMGSVYLLRGCATPCMTAREERMKRPVVSTALDVHLYLRAFPSGNHEMKANILHYFISLGHTING